MAKLVEILARELKEWPTACGGGGVYTKAMAQDSDGALVRLDHLARGKSDQFDSGVWSRASWTGYGKYAEPAKDHATAIVTRAEWRAAVDALKKAEVVEWNGEGLPPVGIECEINHVGEFDSKVRHWKRVLILAHYADERLQNPVAIYMPLDGTAYCDQAISICFRPIRTPEQIAAEERSEAIMAILDDLNLAVDNLYIAERVYNKGYRKHEPK